MGLQGPDGKLDYVYSTYSIPALAPNSNRTPSPLQEKSLQEKKPRLVQRMGEEKVGKVMSRSLRPNV